MKCHFTLFVGDRGWRIGMVRESQVTIVPLGVIGNMAVTAIAAAKQLAEMGYLGQPVMLAIPSDWCLCATIETDRLERGQRRKAMIYQLEEHLPLASEQFVADFIDQGGSAALGVCAELERLESLLAALTAAVIAVGHISPMAMLTAATLIEEHGSLDILLACDHGQDRTECGHDVIAFERRRPGQWRWLGNDDESLREHLQHFAQKHSGKVQAAIVSDEARITTFAESVPDINVLRSTCANREQAAALAGARILAGKTSPWIDLRRDALAPADAIETFRQPLARLAYAAVLLLFSVIVVTQYRGGQYESLASEHARSQAEVFKSALPNQRLPASVRARLQSEHQRLSELSGDVTGTSASSRGAAGNGAAPTSALESLHTIIAGLPAHIRFRILDLSIEPGLIRIDGQAQSHVDAEQIAVSLERTGKLDIEPPRTQALAEGGVQFIFTARPRAATITTGAQR